MPAKYRPIARCAACGLDMYTQSSVDYHRDDCHAFASGDEEGHDAHSEYNRALDESAQS